MKRIIAILTTVTIALLFFVQTESFAKTEKQAAKRLSVENGGEEVYQSPTTTVLKFKSKGSENQATNPKFGKKIDLVVEVAYKRIGDFWYKIILPVFNPRNTKYSIE